MKKLSIFLICVICLITAAVCFADSGAVTYNSGDVKVSIPAELDDLLFVEIPEEEGSLFNIYARESYDLAIERNVSPKDWSWLLSIDFLNEEEYHKALCGRVPGRVFAKDANDGYYAVYYPSELTLARRDADDPEDIINIAYVLSMYYPGAVSDLRGHPLFDEKSIGSLFDAIEWVDTQIKDAFIADNGLASVKSAGFPARYFARMLYEEDYEYTIYSPGYAPRKPHGVKAADFIEPLVRNARYELVFDGYDLVNDEERLPVSDETIVLNFPEDGESFKFFLNEEDEHYIGVTHNPRTRFNSIEMVYKVIFEEDSYRAPELVNDLYRAIILAGNLDYSPDDFTGKWNEKYHGAVTGNMIEINKTDEPGVYSVLISWGKSSWTMTARADHYTAKLSYTDGKKTIIDEKMNETVLFESGYGSFTLQTTGELLWNDETEHTADRLAYTLAFPYQTTTAYEWLNSKRDSWDETGTNYNLFFEKEDALVLTVPLGMPDLRDENGKLSPDTYVKTDPDALDIRLYEYDFNGTTMMAMEYDDFMFAVTTDPESRGTVFGRGKGAFPSDKIIVNGITYYPVTERATVGMHLIERNHSQYRYDL